VAQRAHEHVSQFCAILPQLYQSGSLTKGNLQPSEAWQKTLTVPFEKLARSAHRGDTLDQDTYLCNALLATIDLLGEKTHSGIRTSLAELFQHALKVNETGSRQIVDVFATGNGFQYLVGKGDNNDLTTSMWPALCRASSVYGHSLAFWRALLDLLQREKASLDLTGQHMEPLKRTIMRCLASPSHDLRLTAIYILQNIVAGQEEEVRNIIHTAMLIEQTPLNLETQRSIAMRIGSLAKLYPAVEKNDWAGEAIPTFCLGLLHVRLASVWDDTCSALKIMCETKEGESFVTQNVFEWFSAPETDENAASGAQRETSQRPFATEFECTNVMQLQEHISNIQGRSDNVEEQLQALFKESHAKLPFHNLFSRTQALRLLGFLPHIAEKRSRLLVPVLLDWALDRSIPESEDTDVPVEDIPVTSQDRWARKDQKVRTPMYELHLRHTLTSYANTLGDAVHLCQVQQPQGPLSCR
jgi:U3 small nucleolar RNA-associated protein 20